MTSFFSSVGSFSGLGSRRPTVDGVASNSPAPSRRSRMVSVSNRFGSVLEGTSGVWTPGQFEHMEIEPAEASDVPKRTNTDVWAERANRPRRKWRSVISQKTDGDVRVSAMAIWRGRLCTCMMFLALVLVTYTVLCHLVSPNFEVFPNFEVLRLGDDGHGDDDPASAELLLLALGDWGGMRFWPYTTPGQRAVAAAMHSVAREAGHRRTVVLSLGDNFYNAGVSDVSSDRFHRTFHDVYITDRPELGANDSWRVIAGNHDWKKDVFAQIAYTNESGPWYFPAEYYTFSEFLPLANGGNISVQFVMLDTMILCANDAEGKCNQGDEFERQKEVQFDWINATLAASRADYLVVGGHHPVHSMGSHGSTPALQERLEPLLLLHEVTMYLSGHDHCHQASRKNGLDFHGVGGGAGLKYYSKGSLPSDVDGVFYYSGGVWPSNPFEGSFASITFSAQKVAVTHRNSQGEALLTLARLPRRTSVIS